MAENIMTSNIASNAVLNNKKGFVNIHINSKIFDKDVIYSAVYVFLDKAYILLDVNHGGGSNSEQIIIRLKPKKGRDLALLANEFNNELLNYLFYKNQSTKNKIVRDAIIRRLILTNEEEQLFS